MTTGKVYNGWTLVVILLAAIIIAGGLVILSKTGRSQAVEISLVPEGEVTGEVYVGGAVSNPGYYPLKAGDSVEDIIRAVGGITDEADPERFELRVLPAGEETPQRVDINRAEAWLLAALPGIGEVRAEAIVDYRQQHGLFRNTNELVEVPGIGAATLEQIENLITVSGE